MTSIEKVVDQFAAKAGTGHRFTRYSGVNVFASRWGGRDTIYSYGTHFPMAVLQPESEDNERGWWLVNSDTYSVSTSRHQSDVRGALKRTGLDMLLVPFSALNEAGIDTSTIVPLQILPDRYQRSERPATEKQVEEGLLYRVYQRGSAEANHYERYNSSHMLQEEDGTYTYVAFDHLMGESLFEADYRPDRYGSERFHATFLSSFDTQEGFRRGYFLCQLPEGSTAKTVEQAYAALQPADVLAAIAAGERVTRQGDVFAIPSPLKTSDLPGPSQRTAHVLGTNHTATEVRTTPGSTYARGTLRHAPQWRRPDHKQRKLGDGKTWHRLVKNTVPEGRSWGVSGNVD